MNSFGNLTVVTTCTNLKRGNVSSDLQLRAFAGDPPEEVAAQWSQRLSEVTTGMANPASEVYVGAHWLESIGAAKAASENGFKSSLWVLSAGYGLLNSEEAIIPYSASFTSGEDSIQNLGWNRDESPTERARRWWTLLQQNRRQSGLKQFASSSGAPVIFIISREYYRAIEHELISLVTAGANILIVSAGISRQLSSVSPIVRPSVLPFSERFKQISPYLNNTNTSLNARLANWLIATFPDKLQGGIEVVDPLIRTVADELPDIQRKKVEKLTDEEVIVYIAKHYSNTLDSASPMLRQFRDIDGLSCEQKRFGQLFRKFQRTQQGELF